MTTAAHARCRGLDERQRRAEIQRTPASAPITEIKAWAASPTHAAAITLTPVGPDRHDQLSLTADLHAFHDRSRSRSSRAHTLMPRTSFRLPVVPVLKKPEP